MQQVDQNDSVIVQSLRSIIESLVDIFGPPITGLYEDEILPLLDYIRPAAQRVYDFISANNATITLLLPLVTFYVAYRAFGAGRLQAQTAREQLELTREQVGLARAANEVAQRQLAAQEIAERESNEDTEIEGRINRIHDHAPRVIACLQERGVVDFVISPFPSDSDQCIRPQLDDEVKLPRLDLLTLGPYSTSFANRTYLWFATSATFYNDSDSSARIGLSQPCEIRSSQGEDLGVETTVLQPGEVAHLTWHGCVDLGALYLSYLTPSYDLPRQLDRIEIREELDVMIENAALPKYRAQYKFSIAFAPFILQKRARRGVGIYAASDEFPTARAEYIVPHLVDLDRGSVSPLKVTRVKGGVTSI